MGAVKYGECVLRNVGSALDLARQAVGLYRRNPCDPGVQLAIILSKLMTHSAKASLMSLMANTKGMR